MYNINKYIYIYIHQKQYNYFSGIHTEMQVDVYLIWY